MATTEKVSSLSLYPPISPIDQKPLPLHCRLLQISAITFGIFAALSAIAAGSLHFLTEYGLFAKSLTSITFGSLGLSTPLLLVMAGAICLIAAAVLGVIFKATEPNEVRLAKKQAVLEKTSHELLQLIQNVYKEASPTIIGEIKDYIEISVCEKYTTRSSDQSSHERTLQELKDKKIDEKILRCAERVIISRLDVVTLQYLIKGQEKRTPINAF